MDDREQALIRSAQVALSQLAVNLLMVVKTRNQGKLTTYDHGYLDGLEWAAGEAEARSKALSPTKEK